MLDLREGRLTKVAIIGRPNVGKSSLFNKLTRTRKALVKNEPGVTRDVQYGRAEWWGKVFEVGDTGGLTEHGGFAREIGELVAAAVASSDLVLVLLDGRDGLHPEDHEVLALARRSHKPFQVVVNKWEFKAADSDELTDFYDLGQPFCAVSVEHEENLDQVVEWILSNMPDHSENEESSSLIRIAVLGKPNVGKSSLCNRLLGQDRHLVSSIAGTTSDAIPSTWKLGDYDCELIDTAGLRAPSRRDDGVEFLSAVKSMDEIRYADLVVLVMDATLGPSHQDARLVEAIHAEHKPIVFVYNKMDLARTHELSRDQLMASSENVFHFLHDLKLNYVSAQTGSGVEALKTELIRTWEKLNTRITTSKLNDFFYKVIRQAPLPVAGTKSVKFYYLTQTGQRPPSFIAFANFPEAVRPDYRRFLTKRIQKEWGLEGIPLRLFVMKN